MPQRSRQDIVRQAAELIGHDELAVRLKVTSHVLGAWIRGVARMPDHKLVMLVDILEKMARSK
jgi:hypothetical protein